MAPMDSRDYYSAEFIIQFWGKTLVNTPSKHDVDSMLVQCWQTVGQRRPMLASIHAALVSTSCCRYLHAGGTDTMLRNKAELMLPRHL